MAIRDVIFYPDRRLKQVCSPVSNISDETRSAASDLVDTMASHKGCIGIAAPQVGIMQRMVAVNVSGHRKADSDHGQLILINPQVTAHEGSAKMREGCLSIPDFTADVTRPAAITVEATVLRAPDGEPEELTIASNAFEARLILHELDHLEGTLFLDRVKSPHDIHPRKRY